MSSEIPICLKCPHKKVFHKDGNRTRAVWCDHPNSEYIRSYYKEHNINKAEGFLGFINAAGDFPVKKSPAWCPLKVDGGQQ